jgi:virulence factor
VGDVSFVSPCTLPAFALTEHEGEGRLYVDNDTKGVLYETRVVANSNENFVYGGFQAKNRQFIDAVKTGTQPESNFADAVKTMEVAEKILAQALFAKG